MSMFSDVMLVPIILGAGLSISIIFNLIQRSTIMSLRSSGGEFFTIVKQCQVQNNPLGILVDKGSKGIPFVCTISEKNDAMLESPRKGGKIRTLKYNLVAPSAAQTDAQVNIKGLGNIGVSIFTNPYHFPMNIHSASALCAFGQAIEKDPFLGRFRNTPKMLELCFNRTGTFRLECKKYVRYAVEFNIENGRTIDIPDFRKTE